MKRLILGLVAAMVMGGAAVAAPPVTITSPSGTRQAEINAGDNTLSVRALATPQAIISGRQNTTTSAVALPSGVYTNGLVLRALSTNAGNICIGGSGITTSNGYCLTPGEAISYGAANSNQIYIISAVAGYTLTWTGN